MKIKALKTGRIAHPDPCKAKNIALTEGLEYEVDEAHGKSIIDCKWGIKVSIAKKVVEKAVKKVTKKKSGK